MPDSPFNSLQTFESETGSAGNFFSLPQLEKEGVGPISRLPVSIRVVLESVLRNCDSRKITEADVQALANWRPNADRTEEIPFIVARVLLQDARLIVLDEPFNAIDAKTSADLLALVRRWHSEKRTVLAALHDMDLVRANFPETLLLARGPVAWGATAEVLTAQNLLEARRMCEAFDDSAAACAVDDVPSRAA